MALNLSAYKSIQTNIFVVIYAPSQTLTFSDYHKSFTLPSSVDGAGKTYTGLGQLLSVSQTTNSLRASREELTISISGIPSANVSAILNTKIKGSIIQVSRGFFDPNSSAYINGAGKFRGIISNFEISDDLNMGSDTGEVVLTLTATSVVEMLNNKITGRRTNPTDQKQFYPTDTAMDRVPALAKSNFNFGAPA